MTLDVRFPLPSPRAMGTARDRVDGPLKVTGAAKYTYEYPVASVTYVVPVQSTIAKGRIVSLDASAARALPGVLAVLSHENAPRLAPPRDDQDLAVLRAVCRRRRCRDAGDRASGGEPGRRPLRGAAARRRAKRRPRRSLHTRVRAAKAVRILSSG